MKSINIIGGLTVLLANIYVSFNHSIELFQLGGFSGSIAYVGVIGAEVTFLLGVLNMTVAKLRGAKSGVPAKAGFILGVSLILWSNIHAGLSAGLTGIILGAVTPASLIVAEMIIGKAVLQPAKITQEVAVEESSQPITEETSQTPKVEHPPDLMKTALKLYRQNGKIPSRRNLMQICNITEWQARKTIEALKEVTAK